jgi:hypothetical protein
MKTLRFSALLMSVFLLGPNAARAAALIFDDTSPNETITIAANDFEGGLTINGVAFQQGLNNPATGIFPETGPISFSGRWIDNGLTQPTSRTIYLLEPLDPNLTISDIFHYTLDSANGFGFIQGSFVSDIDGELGTLPAGVNPADVFIENGQPVPFGAPFLSGLINSDIDVPEPGTLSLCLMGLLIAGGFKLRQQRPTGAK